MPPTLVITDERDILRAPRRIDVDRPHRVVGSEWRTTKTKDRPRFLRIRARR